jgi:hypothetical protein
MIESLASGRSATASRSLGLEISDDDGGTVLQDVLRLGDDVAFGGKDVLDKLVVLAEKLAALVVVLDGEPRALNAVVGENGIDERERHRLVVVSLAEIVDGDLGGRRSRRRLRLIRGARAMGYQRDEGDDDDRPERTDGNLQRGHMSKTDARTIQTQTSR